MFSKTKTDKTLSCMFANMSREHMTLPNKTCPPQQFCQDVKSVAVSVSCRCRCPGFVPGCGLVIMCFTNR